MKRPANCDCRCGCDFSPKTLKAFDKATGDLRWHHWLDNCVLSSDGETIYGYAYAPDDSPAAMASTIVRLSGAGTPVTLGIAATAAKRYKKWVRKISADGEVLGDSAFFWYTGNAGYTETPLELPEITGWQPDLFGASNAGELLQITGDFSAGTTLGERMIVWDDNNTTATRRYTLVAAALRDLLTPPTGGAKVRFIAAADGTNAETTIDVGSMIGITAADLATALEAFPHIVSATGTGGPYPLLNIDLEIEWAQTATHFKSVQRLTATCRGFMTFCRDWDTAEITATLAQASPVNSSESLWQFDDDDNIVGVGTNPFTVVGGTAGIAVSKWTRSGSAYTQAWRVRPTGDRPSLFGPGGSSDESRILYKRPAIRGGSLVVTHSSGRGDDQAVGEHSDWHTLNLSTGASLSNGTLNNRLTLRASFATADQLFVCGHDSFLHTWTGSNYQCSRCPPNSSALTSTLAGTAADYFGDYGTSNFGPGSFNEGACCADAEAMFSATENLIGPLLGVWSNDPQVYLDPVSQDILTMAPALGEGYASRVSADSYFGTANYYRITYRFENPINRRWRNTAMEWRVGFFTAASPLNYTTLIAATDWLDFTADVADLEAALDAVVGSNTYGPNSYVEGPDYPETTEEPLPTMLWQRGIKLIMPSEQVNFPATVPPVPYGLNDRELTRFMRIQVKSPSANAHIIEAWKVSRMDWSTGAVIWDVPFGSSIAGGAEIAGTCGRLLGGNYVVSGSRVDGGCLSTYRWQYTEESDFEELGWVLIFADCGTKTAVPPDTAGTAEGDVKAGRCA